jgi:hypothetical protein
MERIIGEKLQMKGSEMGDENGSFRDIEKACSVVEF